MRDLELYTGGEPEPMPRAERDRFGNRTDVLDKVKALRLLPDRHHLTTELVANYYEVSAEVIKKLVQRNREELDSNGFRVISDEELRDMKSLSEISSRATQLALFDRRTVVRVGLLLRDSPIARAVRDAVQDGYEAEPAGGGSAAVDVSTVDRRMLARMVLDAEDRADAEQVARELAEHRAELEYRRNQEYEHAEAIVITTWRKTWFSHVPEDDFWECMYDRKRAGLLINQRLTRPKLDRAGNQLFKDGKPVFKDGHEHRHPTASGQRFLELTPNGVHGGRARFHTKVIPGKEAELALRDYLTRWFGPGRRQIGRAA
ncbi:MAG: hypothetical protein JWQ81_1700 [Amycolatopsis sp.]|jgi:hypothetical protein|uniref:hypothetical protein n=1 Tax=Amycolatopsis sp. TaxID=37632 RepID=UPI00262D2617|nr:hypothetical protein [Amycolatopsis sp.]MCU1680961.1 hypothetical protein [Amycolatopsis sp.]